MYSLNAEKMELQGNIALEKMAKGTSSVKRAVFTIVQNIEIDFSNLFIAKIMTTYYIVRNKK